MAPQAAPEMLMLPAAKLRRVSTRRVVRYDECEPSWRRNVGESHHRSFLQWDLPYFEDHPVISICIYICIYISLYFPKWYSLSIPRSYKVVPQWCFSRWFLGYPPWSSSMYLPENLVKLELCLPVSLTNWGSMLYFKRWCPQTWLEKKQSKWRIEWQNQRRKSKMIHCSVRLREGIWGWKNWTNVADEKCEAIPVNICIGMGIHICNMCVVPFASLYIYTLLYHTIYTHIPIHIHKYKYIYIFTCLYM